MAYLKQVLLVISMAAAVLTAFDPALSQQVASRSASWKPQPIRVAAGTLQQQRSHFLSLHPIEELSAVQALGPELICERYDGPPGSDETLVTMPAVLEFAERPVSFLSEEHVKTVLLKGLWGSGVPFQFQLSNHRHGLFDTHYMPMALAWSVSDYDVNKTSIELRVDQAFSTLMIRTELINQRTGRDDGIMYHCH